ncbi:MAG: hypothetical protein M3O70_01125 [Actinomycetota bacterium]|nr:hypothetical protein [Actinomycetota bacterium]
MKDISQIRFDALASYCRHPRASLFVEEMRWLEAAGERVLVTLVVDTDGEFAGILLARDLKERYRWVAMTDCFPSPGEALSAAGQKVEEILSRLDEERAQGDESGPAVDFFRPVRPLDRLNPSFVQLVTEEGFSPARGIIEPMMRWYEDADGNFIEQFQTTGFDARIWELYLFAALSEAGYLIDRSFPAPDFIATSPFGEFCVEATTVNPTLDAHGRPVPLPETESPEQQINCVREYLPIRYAGPLTTKLAKNYWRLPHVQGRPLVLAIQDFHAPMSMIRSRSALPTYLYGYHHHPRRDEDGSLAIVPERVETHRWGTKEIASGFFMQPGAENVSAVIFNSSATISKFNRIGLRAGFGSDRVSLVQRGFAVDHDPRAAVPKPFVRTVDEDFNESWIEGMDVYHNPRAMHPLDPELIMGAAHHRLLPDGQVESMAPEWQPMASITTISIAETEAG